MADVGWERIRLTRRSFGAGTAALGVRSAMASPVIVVDQPAPLFDATVAIEVRGFPARQPVTITAIQTYPNMSRWQGRATFMSDDEGCVYVALQAPMCSVIDSVALVFPILGGLRIGHGKNPATLPLGTAAMLDADAGIIEVESGAGELRR
jgi:Acyl-CoA thioester hydrolase/BAAT N-terminal region